MPLIGPIYALISAAVWGSGDFLGGFASRRSSIYQVLVLNAVSGIVLILGLQFLFHENFVSGTDALIALAAGTSGAIGVLALYHGLTLGNTALVAPTSSVTAAFVPVAFELARRNPPNQSQTLGFILALLGIWLVSGSSEATEIKGTTGLSLGLLAGLGFGVFFLLIAQVKSGQVFAPLVASKLAALVVALSMVGLRKEGLVSPRANPVAVVAGVLDGGGNLFYVLAVQHTRLDVAAVLASLYPAATVLLASWVTHEKVGRRGWAGVGLCLGAVMLITW